MGDVIGMGVLSVVIFWSLSAVFQSGEVAALLALFALPGMVVGCAYVICRKIDEAGYTGDKPGGRDRVEKEAE